MFDLLTLVIVLALVGGGFMLVRRFMTRHRPLYPPPPMYPPMEMQDPYDPKDDYGRRSYPPGEGYDDSEYQRFGSRYGRPVYDSGYNYRGYGRPMYGPGYPEQSGMSPLAAGGLGALGGGLLGYHLGHMAGEQTSETASPDRMASLGEGGYDPGMSDADSFDAGFADMGADFGGDFGGEW